MCPSALEAIFKVFILNLFPPPVRNRRFENRKTRQPFKYTIKNKIKKIPSLIIDKSARLIIHLFDESSLEPLKNLYNSTIADIETTGQTVIQEMKKCYAALSRKKNKKNIKIRMCPNASKGFLRVFMLNLLPPPVRN